MPFAILKFGGGNVRGSYDYAVLVCGEIGGIASDIAELSHSSKLCQVLKLPVQLTGVFVNTF